MPFFSNLKKVLNLGSSGFDSKKRKASVFANIKAGANPEEIWEIVGELGDGAFGKVHKARHRDNPERFAAAKICVLESEEELEDFTVEIDILSEVRHENVIELYEAYYHQDKLWVSDQGFFALYFRSKSGDLSIVNNMLKDELKKSKQTTEVVTVTYPKKELDSCF